ELRRRYRSVDRESPRPREIRRRLRDSSLKRSACASVVLERRVRAPLADENDLVTRRNRLVHQRLRVDILLCERADDRSIPVLSLAVTVQVRGKVRRIEGQ